MKNIVLIGFMGTGKSAIGKILAEKLSFHFYDIDKIIEEEQKMSINEIFKKYGETVFRDIEADIILRLSKLEKAVIATGGGAVLRDTNVINLREKGLLVCLTASAETIYERLKNHTDRPLLQVKNPFEKIKELLNLREQFYKKADITINTENKTLEQIAGEILEKIKLTTIQSKNLIQN
ncbi:MAG: shikimate kinase [Thermodesulfovibrionales bacterium]|nr:shikimate kinase [Thermodesulfovibrionales bacterium]